MQVTKEGIERIKSANDLAGVLAERGIATKRKGKSLVASCPFHEEKTPSFTVTPSKGLFHCFGCGVSGDVIGFVSRYDKVSFKETLESLARRAGLSLEKAMKEKPRRAKRVPTKSNSNLPSPELLSRVVEHYHQTLCEREEAQDYLKKRGLTDPQLVLDYRLGYADGSLLKLVPKEGELREQLLSLGVITKQGRELLGGCVVVPIPDPLTGQWVSFYGRGMKTERHCYLPGPFRGVVNFHAARSSSEIILTESVLDALSFHQAGIKTAIPIYGTNGLTSDHLDLLKRENVSRVVLALDNDEPGRKATETIKEKITSAGISASLATFPKGIKDANELLLSRNGDAGDVFQQLLSEVSSVTPSSHLSDKASSTIVQEEGQLVLRRNGLAYRAKSYPPQLGRLRATVKVETQNRFHVDTLDLYSSRSRTEFGRRVSKALGTEEDAIEADLLALLVEAEKAADNDKTEAEASARPSMTETERKEALALLKRSDLLDQVSKDIDTLGYVGEDVNKRLLYLVAISRKLADPLSAVILSQSGAGKSVLTEVIERLTPPEDVVLLTRLTPQSLYYVDDGFLDQKLVIIEERYGSMEADYSIRVLQSRKKLIAAAPIKDPQTGNMRTRVFSVEARAAFIEATTASQLNHENATRCFELAMDESVEQTRRIHERQRRMKTEAGLALREEANRIAQRHWNAQRLLETVPVVIPFAEELTFPSFWMRTRRDHARFLNLIEVSAFLHQFQRKQKNGVVLATVEDYEVAYRLARTVLTDTLSDLKAPLRKAYEYIRELAMKAEEGVSRRDVREAVQVPDSTVRRWLEELVELDYLEAEKRGQGKTARYRLTGRGPKEELVLGLLSPKDLRREVKR
jgi:DNA primase catalytic core